MTCSIKPLFLGKFKASKGQYTYFVDWEKVIWVANACWYIRAGDKNVLVDTGIAQADFEKYLYGQPYEPAKSFIEALDSVGITPDDVDIVIQTHLHFDHCGHTALCKNAKIIVQETELKFAYSPHALFFGSYSTRFLKDVRFHVIHGDCQILPDIRVIFVPGHTPGTQAVAVDTKEGVAVISGFCSIKENFSPPENMRTRWPILAPGVSVNSLQAFDNAMKIKGLADIIIPNHDVDVAQEKEIPQPGK